MKPPVGGDDAKIDVGKLSDRMRSRLPFRGGLARMGDQQDFDSLWWSHWMGWGELGTAARRIDRGDRWLRIESYTRTTPSIMRAEVKCSPKCRRAARDISARSCGSLSRRMRVFASFGGVDGGTSNPVTPS